MMNKLLVRPQPTFPEAVKEGCQRIFDFTGRTRRSSFWWFMLAYTVCYFFLTNVWKAFFPLMLAAIFDLGMMFFALAITVRRLQDHGSSKWWAIVNYLSITIYTLYIYGSGIGEALVNINSSTTHLTNVYQDPVFMTTLSIALITALVTFVLCLLDSQPKTNKYGASPKYVLDL